uniref:Hemicentin-2 n=1 Tax=Monodelphis domestica TaxID=13616 RepID=A0A5F8HA67_MONDO
MTPWALMWLPGLGLPLLLVTTAVGGPPGDSVLPASGDATLAFVFDVTGSMWDDLRQVVEGASRILERSLSGRSKAIANYALVPFHDPDIGPVTLTSDPAVFQRELRELYVQGGGDCPEMSIGAIKAAVEISNPSSFIYVFSDARAKDYHRKPELLRLLQLKQSQVVFVLTGDCGDRTHPGYLAYEEIAATSSGQVFHLDKQQVNEVLKWVEEAIQVSKVHLLSTDHEKEGEHTWKIPFDPSLKEVTISLSGPGPEIEVRDPLGRILQKDEGLNMLLNIPDSAKVVAFKPEHPGLWSIKVYSSGRHSVRITGISNINFRAGFTTQPSLDLNHTIEWPLQGVPISLVINSTGLLAPGRLDSVELSHSSGQPLLTLPAGSLSNTSSHQLWVGPPFRVPKERFYLKVKGEDHEGNPLHRVSNVAYNGVAPGSPLVTMPNKIHGYLWQPLLISCSVHSSLPFRLQLRRNGVKLGEERESGNSTWEIPRASKSEEGVYECTAMSRAGTGKAKTQLVVTDPPPQLASPQNVTVSPGETALLSCQVLDKAPYNLTWVRDWRVLPASPGRVVQLANLSLEISGIIPSDGGKYQCLASNANGITRASVWLLIRGKPSCCLYHPQFKRDPIELRISCTASGYPPPHISWRHNDQTIGMDGRFLVDDQGTLIIQSVTPEDAGNYSCQATNEVGTDEQTVTLFYTGICLRACLVHGGAEEIRVGSFPAVLECKASGVPPPRVIWYRGGLEMILAPEVAHTGTLRIQEVQERDAGNYICKAVNELGAASADIRLEVGYAPRLVESSRNMVVEMGRNAILACRAEGRPSPRITWARVDGKPVPAHPVEGNRARQLEAGVLFLENVTPEDQALYICEAHNTFGKAQAEVQLTVIGHEPPQIASSASMVRVLEGQPASLPCVVLAGKPFPQRRYSIRTDGSFHIDRALQEDAGRYSCVVTNTVGSQRQDIELAVQGEPGGGRPRRCAQGRRSQPPEGSGAWGAQPSSHSSTCWGSLYLPQPSAQDSGTYVCTATNALGISSQEIQLSVNTKPRIIMNESLDSDRPVTITALAGKELTLHCEAEGSPSPLITWTKDSQLLSPITDRHSLLPSGSLKLAETSVEDNGLYTCIASNPAGTASRSYVLGVQVPPQIQQGPQLLKVLAGESLDLTCVATGDPKPQLRWSKDGITLPQKGWVGPDGSVHLESVQVSDSGHYHCVASSEAGEDARELELEVLEPPRWEAEDILMTPFSPLTIGTPTPRVIWRKDPAPELLSSQPGLSVLNDSSLFIASVSSQDSGDYECRATNEVGSVSRKVKLVVYVPPHFRGEEQRVNVSTLASRPLTLNCDVSGFPTPAITWYKDGRPVNGAPSLHFPQVQKSDSDLYTCQAVNPAGMAQKDFNLLDSLVLACTHFLPCPWASVLSSSTPFSRPVAPGDPHIQLVEDGQVLKIPSSHLGDAGHYQCVAFSPAGQQAKDFQLTPPTIWGSNETGEVAVMEDHVVRLQCDARGVPTPAITWLKDGDPLHASPRVAYAKGGRHLQLGRARGSDSGLYTCQASNAAGIAEKAVRLDVYVPPTIEGADGGPLVVKAVAGRPLALGCSASGHPPPTLTWHQDENPLTENNGTWLQEGGRVLRLERVTEAASGHYSCLANSPAGETVLHYMVEVQVIVITSYSSPHSHSAIWILRWLRNGRPAEEFAGVEVSTDGAMLRIDHVQPDHNGLFACQATNEAGTAGAEVEVLVHGKSSGKTDLYFLLLCFSGISWYRGRQPISSKPGLMVSSDGRVLRIKRAQLSDAGSYRCVASNVAGSSELKFGLRINGEMREDTLSIGNSISKNTGIMGLVLSFAVPPRITLAPSLPGPVLLNEPVRLVCNATGAPTPMLMWLKDGNPVSATGTSGLQIFPGGHVLTLAGSRATDAGTYTCVAVNAVGEDRRDVTLQVHLPPSILGEEQNVSVVVNQSVTLECQSQAVPPPVLSWRKDGHALSPRPGVHLSADGVLLQVERAEVQDVGRYTCEALNKAGRSEKHYNLNVWGEVSLRDQQLYPLLPTSSPVYLGMLVPTDGGSTEPISAVGRLLYLGKAQPSQEGNYTCECSNIAGNSSQEQHLEVYGEPKWDKKRAWDPLKGLVRLKSGQLYLSHGCDQKPYKKILNGFYIHVFLSTAVAPKVPGSSDFHKEVSVIHSGEVTLECEATGKPPPVVTWEKDGQLVTRDQGLLLQHRGRALQVEQARAAHAGRYTCIAENEAGRAEQRFDLSVLVPPRIENEDTEEVVKVPEGQSAYLTCNVTGNSHPQPTVTWFKDGRTLSGGDLYSISPDGSLLEILQANFSSSGHYSCIASNSVSEKTKHYKLSVLVGPTILGATEDNPDEEVTVTINNPISLICEALAFPSPTVTWMKDGAPFQASGNTQLLPGDGTHGLQILNAQEQDAGRYTCVVTNEVGEAVKNYHVEVLIPPSISKDDPLDEFSVKEVKAKVNSTLSLECESWAMPPPTITWYKDGQLVSPDNRLHLLADGRLLQINPTKAWDSGRYLCVATNVAGEDDKDFNVLVQVPPIFQKIGDPNEAFEVHHQEEELRGGVLEYREIVENNPAYLYCDTNAVPPPQLTWYKDDQPLSDIEGGRVLQIPMVRSEDAGRYTCKASNEVGEDWLHYELLVLTPPVIQGDPEELVEEVTVNANSTVNLQCQALGTPTPVISWLRNGLPFIPSSKHQALEDGQVLQVRVPSWLTDVGRITPPRITGLNPERITAIVNSSVSLPCDVHSHPSPEVTWYKDGWALPFSEDIFLLPGGLRDHLIFLLPSAPPTIKQTPGGQRDTTVVRVGDTAVLHCESDTLPEPVITWYKNGQQIALDQQVQTLLDGQKLEIVNVQVADKGLYSCKVSNIVGEAIRTFVLIVQVPPIFENPEKETLSQVAGNPLVLVCDVAGVPAPTVTWLKDRMPVGEWAKPLKSEIEWLSPVWSIASIWYWGLLGVLLPTLTPSLRTFPLLTVAPRILSSGVPQEHNILEEQEVRLECEAEGQPQPDISWLKDGRPLGVHTAPHLRYGTALQGVRPFSCSWLLVPSILHLPSIYSVNTLYIPDHLPIISSIRVLAPLRLVTMACPARGSPPIQINWLKDGLPMPLSQRTHLHSSGRTLRISQVQVADAGTFTCVASSPAGVAERTFSLQIHEPSETKDAMAVVRGSDVTLPCEARGSPLPAVSWLKDGASLMLQRLGLGSGSSLQLEAVQADDVGTYSCVAINEAGEATRHFQLAVMEPPHIEDSGQAEEMLLLPGAPLELICNALGSPMPNITWQKDGQVLARLGSITKDGRVLRVEGVQVDDAGLYTCLAENPAGEDGKNFLVRVQAPPNIVGSRETRTVIGLADGQLVLECPVEADPPPKIEWHREVLKNHVSLWNGRFLQLQALDTSDSGDYNCVASNAAGSTSPSSCLFLAVAPTIQPGPSVVNVSVNETALLPCKTRGLPVSLVSWRKDGIPLVPGSPRYKLDYGSLRIQPVYPQDSGYYLCQASNSAGSDRQGRELRVFEPPTIAPGPSNLTLTVHTQATLPCEARGSPKPHVVWKKNGQTLSLDRHQEAYRLLPSSSLVLTDPDLQDTAQFECLVSNDAGETRRLFWVTVYVPPTIADDRTDFTVTKMAPVVLTCHTTGVPTPVVSWSKGGAQLGKRGSGYRVSPTGALEIEQALPIHTGRYTCTARNAAGVAHKHVILMVQASPVINPLPSVVHVMALDDVVLPCEASGIPRPTITWQKEGLSIPTGTGAQILSSGQLRISRASAEDAGNYLCIAKNPSGTALGKTRLVGGHSDLSAAEGSQALLPCIAQGIPEPHITWKKDGFVVPSMEGKYTIQPSGELLVKNSERRDAGTYTCIAENAAGHTSRRVHLSILSLPTFTTLPGDLSLNHGDRLWLRCTARGSPTPHISWMVNNRLVKGLGFPWLEGKVGVLEQDGGSTLQRAAVTREDSGTYTCWAENIVGKVQAVSAPIFVVEPQDVVVRAGGTVVLLCQAAGEPVPTVEWTHDGHPIRVNQRLRTLPNGSLQFKGVEMDDMGEYECVAHNLLGTATAHAFVAVKGTSHSEISWGEYLRLDLNPEPPVSRPDSQSRELPSCPCLAPFSRYSGWCYATSFCDNTLCPIFPFFIGDPRGSRGRMVGEINGQEFGVAYLNTSVLQEDDNGATTIQSSINNIPPEVGPLMRILVVAIAPIYWVLAGQSGEVLNGYSLTKGNFRQESQVEFATGELLHLTQVARGLDRDGLLLLDVVVNGFIPEALALAQLQVQDFQERYVQIGPGQLYVGSTQTFLKDGAPTHFRCNHTIQYDSVLGPQPQLVQHLRATEVSSAFDPGEEALRFQGKISICFADENEADCPEGFVLDSLQAFCTDKDECSSSKSPCSHTCHNSLGRFSCSCPSGYALAWDNRNCKDVDECAWDTSVCHDGQRCVNLLGSYQCLPHCRTGFQATADGTGCEVLRSPHVHIFYILGILEMKNRLMKGGKECQWVEGMEERVRDLISDTHPFLPPDVNECLEHLDECRYNQICENILGGHRCTCPPGYRSQGHGHPCLDINECLQLPKVCAYQCHNLQGSYRCLCPPGQALLQDGKACGRLEKIESNVTTISYQGSFPSWRAATWAISDSAFFLSLPPILGPSLDLDECQVRTLCQHACRNTEGSYQCLCPAGYRLLSSGKNCQDINECVEEGIKCGPSQMCFNTRGSYQCVDTPCPATYRRGSSPGLGFTSHLMCFRRCALDCSSGGPFTLQYKLLTLPFGIRADHDVVRLTAFSDGGVLPNRTVLTVLEPDPNSPFALREPQSGQGAIYTRRPLTDAGVYRLKVQAVTYGEHRILRYQNVFVILISVSPYPY